MRLAIKFLSALKSAASFAIRRPKDAAIILLIFLLVLAGWRLNREKTRSHELTAKIEGLPPGTRQTITIYKDRVITKWRDGAKIVYRDRYLPPEGRVDVEIKDNSPEASPEIIIKNRGFTKRWGGGVIYSGKILPAIDFKWVYWNRYGIIAEVNPQFGGMGLTRHVDDALPFYNLEILGVIGLSWSGKTRLGLGIRTNF
ncbi:MAG: hypothetical protein HY401_04065 [Elusimicrobia bacterium]|nr:hypothetical protein [Elusimicrobiota bacterium]